MKPGINMGDVLLEHNEKKGQENDAYFVASTSVGCGLTEDIFKINRVLYSESLLKNNENGEPSIYLNLPGFPGWTFFVHPFNEKEESYFVSYIIDEDFERYYISTSIGELQWKCSEEEKNMMNNAVSYACELLTNAYTKDGILADKKYTNQELGNIFMETPSIAKSAFASTNYGYAHFADRVPCPIITPDFKLNKDLVVDGVKFYQHKLV